MTYLFKNRFFCTDIFKNLCKEMKNRGYEVLEIIDEDHKDSRRYIDELKGKDITIITSDHLKDDMEYYNQKAYSINQCNDILKPKKKFFGMHDLGIATVDDDVTGYEVFIPDESWSILFNNKNQKALHAVGHPKFNSDRKKKKYDIVFFVSSVYVYADKPIERFKEAFKLIFEHKIPFKFPKYCLSNKLMQYVASEGIELIDPEIESFDILLKTDIAISNANSSIAIEAAMAGCKSINMGWDYKPKSIYEKYNIVSVNEPEINGLNSSHFSKDKIINKAHYDMKFDIDKAIKIITEN